MDFIKGMEVKFIGNSKHVPNYTRNGIPERLMKHGNTKLHENYNAKVEDTYGEYIIVSYTDNNNKRVQLGFLPDKIKAIFTTWKERYGDIKNE